MARLEGREKPLHRGGAGFDQRNRSDSRKVKSPRTKPVTIKLTIDPRSDWYATELPPLKAPAPSNTPVPPTLIEQVQRHARALLEDEATSYAESHLKASSSYKFMSTIMSSGTWSDKVSALTLVVQESPLHTVKPLENLIGLASKRSRDQALMALGALKDLLGQGNVLPDRKLRMFSKQPGLLSALQGMSPTWTPGEELQNGLRQEHLMLWAYEDRLKSLYFDMLKTLEKWGNDEVEFARLRAVTFIWELLRDKPEQEENLLRLLINKLGDTSKKVASRASHLLLQLQTTHPSMKSIIVSSIESDVLLRFGQSSHAKYYAVITLNQTVLQTNDPEVANKLLDVYFSIFIAILNQSQRTRDAPTKFKKMPEEEHEANTTEDLSRKRKRARAPQPSKVDKPEGEINDKITAQILTGINRAFPFSKKDSMSFEKHLDTMFRISHSSNFNTSIQALMLIQQISSTHSISTDRFMRTLYESLLDPRLINSSKQTMYLNLLYRSLKSDTSIRRVKAFVKRLVQALTLHEPPFIVAALYLLVELRSLFPGLQPMFAAPETHDAPSDDEATATDAPAADTNAPVRNSSTYDGRARNPSYSNADLTCLWELLPWTSHYHPSVTLFSNYLFTPTGATPPKPDPATHTLSHFLDRFAYRNPKTKESSGLRGQSIMQPALASSGATDSLLATGRRSTSSAPSALNDEAFWQRKASDIREDEAFFHRYFGVVNAGRGRKKDKAAKRERDEDGDEGEEVDQVDEEGGWDEDEVWKAIVGSKGMDADAGDEDDFDDDDVSLDMGNSDADVDGEMDGDSGGEDGESDGGVEIDLASDEDSDVGDEVKDEDKSAPKVKQDKSSIRPSTLADQDAANDDDDDDDAPFALDEDSGSALFSSESDEESNQKGTAKGKGKSNKRKEMTAEEVRAFIAERAAEAEGEAEGVSIKRKGKEGKKKGRKGRKVEEDGGEDREEDGLKGKKRRKLRALPMFGEADEWAALVGGEEGEEDEAWRRG